ncbi:MAG TPA: serine/threonine-protein kinase, partial [Gemmatimonadaceae bacterium]|nr:serine/threonine-protein kinase [Gemmatimonadaceae bacterium]
MLPPSQEPAVSRSHCGACDAATSPGSAFCPECGARLGQPDAAQRPDSAGDLWAREEEEFLELAQADLELSLAPRYTIVRRVGRGGMGAVFLGSEPALRRQVAIKVLAPEMASDPQMRARFEREGRAAAELSHPNVVRVYGVGETGRLHLPYIVMQFVEGCSLDDWIERNERPKEWVARRLLGEVAGALAAAHARGLVHRDIKPSNVLVEEESGRAYVADFGLTGSTGPNRRDQKLTATGTIIGTVTHMSPEQVSGEAVGTPSDVYSFGVMAYELLTGELPYRARAPMEWAAAHLRDTPPPVARARPDLSPELALLVDRCLAKDPAARPAARALADALLPTPATGLAWPPPGLAPVRVWFRRLTRVDVAAGAVALLVLLALAFPPDAVRAEGAWWERFASTERVEGTGVEVARSPGAGGVLTAQRWVWLAALGGGSAAAVLLLVATAAAATGAAAAALRGREWGWSWRTISDVAADPDGRSELALTGAREFAPLDDARRASILRSRRALLLGRLAAGAWASLGVALWATMAAFGLLELPGAGPVAGAGTVALVAAPALLLAAIAAAAALAERRALRPLPWRAPHRGAASGGASAAPGPSAREVAAWYDALPADAPSAGRRPSPGSGRWRPALAAAAAAAAAAA